MSTASILAGLGAGTMAGLSFMQQKQAQDARLGMAKDELAMRQETQGWQKEAHDNLKAQASIAQKYATQDLSNPEVFDQYVQEAMPYMSPEQIAASQKTGMTLNSIAGGQAMDRFLNNKGDVSGFDAIAKRKMPGSSVINENGVISFVSPDGTKQQFATAQGLASLGMFPGAMERIQAKAKADAEQEKLASETAKNIAYADYMSGRNQTAEDVAATRAAAVGSRAAGKGAKAGGSGADGSAFSIKAGDLEKYAPINPDTQKPDTKAMALIGATAESIHQNNPNLRGSEQQIMYAASQIASGEVKPEPILDPQTNTYRKGVKWGGKVIYLGSGEDTDPMAFYKESPALQQQVVANDKAWTERTLSGLPRDQADELVQAMAAATPEGRSAREQIISAYGRFQQAQAQDRAAGMEPRQIPMELQVKYNALRTADRLKQYGPQPKDPEKATEPEVRKPKQFPNYGGSNPSMVGEMWNKFGSGVRRHLEEVRRKNAENDYMEGM